MCHFTVAMPQLFCPVCKSCRLPSIQLMLQHIYRIHSTASSFNWMPMHIHKLWKHVKRMHSHYFAATTELPADDIDATMDDTPADTPVELDDIDQEYESIENPSSLSEIEKQRLRATWILKTRETNMLTQRFMENLLSDVTDFCSNIIDELKVDILHKLRSASTPSIVVEEINATCEDMMYRQPFAGLDTQYKQLQFYRRHFNFVVISYYTLGWVFLL